MHDLVYLVIGAPVGFIAWRGYRYWEWLEVGVSVTYLTLVVVGYMSIETMLSRKAVRFSKR